MKLPAFLLFLILPTVLTYAYDADDFPWVPTGAVSALDADIEFEKGKFSIIAKEFELDGPEDSIVVIFLINDTDEEIVLPSQDGDVYLKQEAKIDGEWRRVQPHRYSWCGNSYIPVHILPKRYRVFPDVYHGWAPPVEGDPNDEFKLLPVRYRFYGGSYTDLVTNELTRPVSLRLAKIAETDAMAIETGTPEFLAPIATGERVIESVDHMDPRMRAIHLLGEFPDSPIAKETIIKLLNEPLRKADSQTPEEFSKTVFYFKETVYTASKVLSPEKFFEILKFQLESPIPEKGLVLRQLSKIPGFEAQQIEILDSYLDSPNNPLFVDALRLRCGFWSDSECRAELKSVFEDDSVPKNLRNKVRKIYYDRFPNDTVMIWTKYSFDTALQNVSIENISEEPIRLEYSHVYDLIASQIEIDWGSGDFVPYRSDFEEVVNRERHEKRAVVIQPEERLELGEVNIWRYHQIPESLPDQFAYRIVSNHPEFGDVPAGVGVTGFFETDDSKELAILEAAREEQKSSQ